MPAFAGHRNFMPIHKGSPEYWRGEVRDMETDRRANRRTATRLKRGKQADRRSIPLIGRFARRPNC